MQDLFAYSSPEARAFFEKCGSKFPISTAKEKIIKNARTIHENRIIRVRRGENGRIYKSYDLVNSPKQKDLDSCKREVKIFEAQPHENPITAYGSHAVPIGKIYGAYCGRGRYAGMIFLEMEDCGDELDVAKPLPTHPPERAELIRQVKNTFGKILDGGYYMHNKLKIAHLDLKPENIGRNGKIFDFGECLPIARLSKPSKDGSDSGGHGNHTEEYTPYDYGTKKIGQRTQTVDIFAMGVILLEMICGKISAPSDRDCHNGGVEHAFGWKLVVDTSHKKVVWKAKWTVGVLKTGEAPGVAKDVETPLTIPACRQATLLVRTLLQDYDSIKWSTINKLYREFNECTCNFCRGIPGAKPGRRLIERFIRASEYCISS